MLPLLPAIGVDATSAVCMAATIRATSSSLSVASPRLARRRLRAAASSVSETWLPVSLATEGAGLRGESPVCLSSEALASSLSSWSMIRVASSVNALLACVTHVVRPYAAQHEAHDVLR